MTPVKKAWIVRFVSIVWLGCGISLGAGAGKELVPFNGDYYVPQYWTNPRISGEPFWYVSKYLEAPTLDPVWRYYCKAAQQTGFRDANNGYVLIWSNFFEDPQEREYFTEYFPILRKMVLDKKKAYITFYSRSMFRRKDLKPLHEIPESYMKLSSDNADFYLGEWMNEWGYAFRSMLHSSGTFYKEKHEVCYSIFKNRYGHEPKTRDDIVNLVPILYEVYGGYTNKTNPPVTLAMDDGPLEEAHGGAADLHATSQFL